MLYTDTVGLVGWLKVGSVWMDGYTLGLMDRYGLEWNATEDYGMMILLLCVNL
jgi:hypothetical protein